jgi:hypothetical protein
MNIPFGKEGRVLMWWKSASGATNDGLENI